MKKLLFTITLFSTININAQNTPAKSKQEQSCDKPYISLGNGMSRLPAVGAKTFWKQATIKYYSGIEPKEKLSIDSFEVIVLHSANNTFEKFINIGEVLSENFLNIIKTLIPNDIVIISGGFVRNEKKELINMGTKFYRLH